MEVLHHEVVVYLSGPHPKPVVLKPMVRFSLATALADMAHRSKALGVVSHPDHGPKCLRTE